MTYLQKIKIVVIISEFSLAKSQKNEKFLNLLKKIGEMFP